LPKSDQWPNYSRKRMNAFYGKNLFSCLKRNHIANHKFLMRESRYFNGLSRELNGFVTRIYLLVASKVPNEGSVNLTGLLRELEGMSRQLNGWSRDHNECVIRNLKSDHETKVSILKSYIFRSF
jgi:hypothetical protein